ncbi:MAG: hypothetical protein WKF43_01680 [Acidimicrobiales bacterium]
MPADALARLELDAGNGVSLLPRGTGPLALTATSSARMEVLAGLLASDHRPVVADCGVLGSDAVAAGLAAGATHSLLVTRPCYLALRRVTGLPVRPSGVVLINEPGRALGRADVESVVGAPVRAEIGFDPTIARAVDSGVLAGRMPRQLDRALRAVADPLAA